MTEVGVLGLERVEAEAFERVVLRIPDAGFRLALVLGFSGQAGKRHEAGVARIGGVGRIELRLVEVRLQHARLQIVDHDDPDDAAQRFEGPLVAADEGLHVLAPDDLLVGVPRVRQHHLEEPRPNVAPVLQRRRAFPEVDLDLLAGTSVDPREDLGRLLLEATDEALDAVVAVLIALFDDEILIDPLRREARLQLPPDDGLERRGVRRACRPAIARRFGRSVSWRARWALWPVLPGRRVRIGGHFGRIWAVRLGSPVARMLRIVARDRLAPNPGLPLDPPVGPAQLEQAPDKCLLLHLQNVRHALPNAS